MITNKKKKQLTYIQEQSIKHRLLQIYSNKIENLPENIDNIILFNPIINLQSSISLNTKPAIVMNKQYYQHIKHTYQQNTIINENMFYNRYTYIHQHDKYQIIALCKSLMCSDLLKKSELLKYSKQILTYLISIVQNMQRKIFDKIQDENLQYFYPQYVLKYYKIFYHQSESVLILLCQDYSHYKNAHYFIERQAFDKNYNEITAKQKIQPSNIKEQIQFVSEKAKQKQEDSNYIPFMTQKLTQQEILNIAIKVMKGFVEIRKIQHQINKQKFNITQQTTITQLRKYNDSNQFCHILKHFSPQQDILIDPENHNVKLYNFGFKEDLDLCNYQYKSYVADSNFVYRHPSTVQQDVVSCQSKQRYYKKYIKQGLKQSDLIWQTAMFIFRLSTGRFPFSQNNQYLKKITRSDFDWIINQMWEISQNGIRYNIQQIKQQKNICLEIADLMFRFSKCQEGILSSQNIQKWIQYIQEIAINELTIEKLKNLLLKQQIEKVRKHSQSKKVFKQQKIVSSQKLTKKHKIKQKKMNMINKRLRKFENLEQSQRKEIKFFLMNNIQKLKKKIKLEIQPLNDMIKYTNKGIQSINFKQNSKNLKNTQKMISQEIQNNQQNKKQMTSIKLIQILFIMLLQLRRRSKKIIYGNNQTYTYQQQQNIQNLKFMMQEIFKINNHHNYEIFQIRSEIGCIQKSLKKIIQKTNKHIFKISKYFKEVYQQNKQNNQIINNPLFYISKHYYDLFNYIKTVQNSEHKLQKIKQKQIEQKQIDKFIENQIKNETFYDLEEIKSLIDTGNSSNEEDQIKQVSQKIVEILQFNDIVCKISSNINVHKEQQFNNLYEIYTCIKSGNNIKKGIAQLFENKQIEFIENSDQSTQNKKIGVLQSQLSQLSLQNSRYQTLKYLYDQKNKQKVMEIEQKIKDAMLRIKQRKKYFIQNLGKKIILI